MGFLNKSFGMTLMPAKPGVCPKCGRDHEAGWPHDRDSLLFQYTFFDEHGYFPSWNDALEGCSEGVKAYWTEQLTARGINPDERPEVTTMQFEIKPDRNAPAVGIVTVKKEEKP